MVFYEGDIQVGVAQALREQKCVVCFIRSENEESNKWATEWLCDPDVSVPLEQNAVTFQLRSDSVEAASFAAFCPIDKIPTVAVIYQGQLIQQINPGASKNDFNARLLRAVQNKVRATQSTTSTSSNSSNSTAALFEERRRRFAAEETARKAAEQAEKAEKQERERKRRREVEAANPARSTYLREQAEKKKQDVIDRERIRARIEEDRLRRKEQDMLKKQIAEESAQLELQNEEHPSLIADYQGKPKLSTHDANAMTAVQVRLLDGRSIREFFSTNSTTLKDVRTWVDQAGDDVKQAYSFKEIRTPKPSRSLDDNDESKSLAELGLDSATRLALVSRGNSTGEMNSTFAQPFVYLYMMVLAIFTWLKDQYTAVSSVEHAAPAEQPTSGTGTGAEQLANRAEGNSIRIRTLQDQRPNDEETKFYNGNQLNFEPNANEQQSDEDSKDK